MSYLTKHKRFHRNTSYIYRAEARINVSDQRRNACQTYAQRHLQTNVSKEKLQYNIYIGETARRLQTRIDEHGGKDKNSQMYKHSMESGHRPVAIENVKILATGAQNNKGRKTTEALCIKSHKPSLNIQEMSVPLKLF